MDAAPALTSMPRWHSRGWVRAPWWDGFWILSALWLAPLVFFLARGYSDPATSPVDSVYLVLTACFWIGHRVSSTYLAYCTEAYRPLLRAQRTRFVWVPLGIVAFVFGFLFAPESVIPLPWAERVILLVIFDYALVTYHFAAQHYGALSLYRVRAGQARDKTAKRIDRFYALGIGGVLIFFAELIAGTVFYQERWIDPIVDPEWIASVHSDVQVGGTLLVALLTLWMLAREWRSEHASLPRAAYLVGLALMAIVAFHVDPFLFVVLWTAQHWMVAMGLATRVARADPQPARSTWYRLWHGVSVRPWLMILVLVAVSVVLLPVMEVEAVEEGGVRYGERLFPFLENAFTDQGVISVLVAVGFITAFLHYTLDRAVFRFSHPEVRKAARGLLD